MDAKKMIYCTKRGHQNLEKKRKELEEKLAEVKRTSVPLARADPGNLWHDNAPFEEAERSIHHLTSLLEEITEQLDAVEIVDPKKHPKDKVGIGSKVEIDIDGEKRKFVIVGWGESNPERKEISYASPIGKALMGAKPGDHRKVSTPEKDLTIEVVRVL